MLERLGMQAVHFSRSFSVRIGKMYAKRRGSNGEAWRIVAGRGKARKLVAATEGGFGRSD